MTALLIAATTVAAQGAGPQNLHLAFDGQCTGVDVEEVRRIAGIELRARLAQAEPGSPRSYVAVDCRGDEATVRLDPVPGRAPRARPVALAGTAANARARLLALAVAELVTAPELPPDPPAAPPPPQPARTAALATVAAAAPPPASTGVRVLGVGCGRIWPAGWTSLGAGVAASGWVARHALVRADALYEHGTAQVVQGTAVVDSVSAGVAALLAVRPAGWQLGAGLGARLGGTRLGGRPDESTLARGKAFLAASGGPMGVLLVAPPPLGRLTFELSFEWGRVTMPVDGRAGDVHSFAVEGSWLGATFGAGVGL